jgi:ParB-like chromosome segregation protein Spo0J
VKSTENNKVSKKSKDPLPAKKESVLPKKEVAAEWVETSSLLPWANNPRINEFNVPRVVESIKRFGFGAPILARRADGEIIAGHTRLKAAIELGLDRVPVRYLDLDPADAHLLALADNKLQEFSEWDTEKLLAQLGDLRQQGTDAALVAGFSDADIDRMLKTTGDAVAPQAFQSFDESIETEHKCPKCGYEWS